MKQNKTGIMYQHKPLKSWVRPAGFEPEAYGFEGRTSEFPKRLNSFLLIGIVTLYFPHFF